jgi:hypothetical protein
MDRLLLSERVAERARSVVHRPRLWRGVAAALAVLLIAMVALASQGSLEIYGGNVPSGAVPAWARRCMRVPMPTGRLLLARCASVAGRVVWSDKGRGGEPLLAVLSGFHLVLVQLRVGVSAPGWGSEVKFVGPMIRARDGQREIYALDAGR